MKENSSSGLSSPSAYTNWSTTEDEILVAEILLQLPTLILERESLSGYKFPITWGSKRRRSAHENRPSLLCSSSSLPGALAVGSTSDADADLPPPTLKVEASSPATPLSFSPSESEDKPKPSRRKLHVKRVIFFWFSWHPLSCSVLLYAAIAIFFSLIPLFVSVLWLLLWVSIFLNYRCMVLILFSC